MFRSGLIVSAGIFFLSWAHAAEEDPVRKKLDLAKSIYRYELTKFRTEVTDWFESVEKQARNDGKKPLVDQIKEEKAAFSEFGDLPKDAPARIRKKRSELRASMESDYRKAIKEYLKAKNDTEAGVVEKELNTFNEERAGVEVANEKTLVGIWGIRIGGWTSDFTFNQDGTVYMRNSRAGPTLFPNLSGRWVIDMKQQAVVMTWSDKDKSQYRFDLPLDPKLVTGMNHVQLKLEAVKKR